jgi:oxygen-dependent protoporphyrinogen oxidase
MKTVVVGAGIAGLTTAWAMRARHGVDHVLLLEAGPAPGGTARSELRDGCVLDHGANGFLDNVPATLEVVDALGLTPRLVRADAAANARFLFVDGALRRLPSGPGALLTTPLMPLGVRLRILREPWVRTPPPDGDESVTDFVARRFGAGAAHVLAQPMVTGITAGDAAQTSMASLFPRVAEWERAHGSVIGGMMAQRRLARREGRTGRPRLTTLEGGLGTLTAAMGEALGASLRCDAPVAAVRRDGTRWQVELRSGEAIACDAVVLAVPAHVAVGLVVAEDRIANALAAIPYVGTRVVTLAYDEAVAAHVPPGFGFLTTPGCGLRTKGCIFVHSIFPGHVDPGMALLRCIVGGFDDPAAATDDDAVVEAHVRDDLRRALGVVADPRFVWHRRWPATIPQPLLHHADRLARIDAALAGTGLHVTGNAYRGVSFNDCVVDGLRTAERIATA